MVADEEFESMRDAYYAALERAESAEGAVENLQEEVDGLETEADVRVVWEERAHFLEAEVHDLKGCNAAANNRIRELEAQRDMLKDLLKKYRCENECLAAQDGQAARLQAELEEASALIGGLKQDNAKLAERVMELDRENDKLGAELAGYMSLEDESADEEEARR